MRGLSSQNVIVRHNAVSSSQFLTFSKHFMTVCACFAVARCCPTSGRRVYVSGWRYPLMFLFAEPKHTCTLNQRRKCFPSRAHSPLLSLPPLIVLTQSAPINKSASAFDDSQCECFFPSNCLRANISFILSHEKSVPSSFQIANFAHFSPCFFFFFLSPSVHMYKSTFQQ